MRQVVVIGGGEVFQDILEIERFIEKMKLDIYKDHKPSWKSNLQRHLGHRYNVVNVKMPNPMDAKFRIWARYFDKIIDQLDSRPVFVGHSLGGLFLLKYLDWYQQQTCQRVIPRATILVASPIDMLKGGYLGDFGVKFDRMSRGAFGNIHWVHGTRDDIVTPHHSYLGQQLLGGELHLIPGAGHLYAEEKIPEILNILKDRTLWRK